MKNINSLFIIIALFIVLPKMGKAQKELKPIVPIEKIDKLFKNWDNLERPGIAVGIVSNGEIVHTKGYGLANLEFDIPNTAETRFYIGELSNQFTAFAILLLESQNKLSLQEDIRKYLPTLPDLGKRIAIEDLIHHTSGIRDIAIAKALSGWKNSDAISKEHTIQLFVNQQKLNYEPGEKQQKNISTFFLLEKIIAEASGTSYTEYIQKNIFDPLKMTNTFFDTASGAIIKNKATGYNSKGDGFIAGTLNQLELNNTNVYSTVGDMCRWLQNSYHPKVGNTSLIKRFSALATLNGQPIEEKNFSFYVNQFYHWNYYGTKKLSHTSIEGGYASKIIHFPDQNMAAVVLGNGGTYDDEIANDDMATMTAELYVEKYFNKSTSFGLVKVAGINMDTKTLASFTGDYWDPAGFNSRTIYLKHDTLMYSRGYNESPIIPIGKNKFQMVTYSNVYVTFENRNNKKSMLVEVEGVGEFEHIAYQKDAPWTKKLEEYAGEYFCQELQTTYYFSVKNNKLIVNNLRIEDIEFSPILKDTFTGNRRYFNELKFNRNNNGINGFQLATSSGDKLWFEKRSVAIAKQTKLN